jgi:hypothetical protein
MHWCRSRDLSAERAEQQETLNLQRLRAADSDPIFAFGGSAAVLTE